MYHYNCSNGHEIVNSPKELDGCPVYVLGEPCWGTLKRFGPGSRKVKKEKAA